MAVDSPRSKVLRGPPPVGRQAHYPAYLSSCEHGTKEVDKSQQHRGRQALCIPQVLWVVAGQDNVTRIVGLWSKGLHKRWDDPAWGRGAAAQPSKSPDLREETSPCFGSKMSWLYAREIRGYRGVWGTYGPAPRA